jgi:hypothetical protein
MEPEVLLSWSQEPSTAHYPQEDQSSSHYPNLPLKYLS